MTLAEELNGLLLSLYRAAREIPLAEFQRAALELIRPTLRFTTARWGTNPLPGNTAAKGSAHLYSDHPVTAAVYEEIKDRDLSVQIELYRRKGPIDYGVGTLLHGKCRSASRDCAKRSGHQNVILAFDVDTAKKLLKWMSFYRADHHQPYDARDYRLARLLVPHLWEALTLNRMTQLEHIDRSGVDRPFKLGIADTNGVLHHAESDFGALLRSEFGNSADRQLPPACLITLLERGRYVGDSVVIWVAQRTDVLFLKARSPIAVDRLSPREREISNAIARGKSYKEIALELAIAPATVRNHIQAIHQKLAVSNAAGLIAQLGMAS